jgi:hypothetical protein
VTDRGATPADWFHFDFVLGLGDNLLPCVPFADDVKVVPKSALEGKVGKIPSMFNRDGFAHGIKDWQKRPIMSAEVQQWSADPRLNICVRLGPLSNVYALDIDIEDEEISRKVQGVIEKELGPLPLRFRTNSAKFLFAFRMETPCKKRKIKLDDKPRGPAIELLADGQQFVAAGTHSSGVRYQWSPELPSSLPTITLDQLNSVWTRLTQVYATKESAQANQTALAQAQSPSSPTSTSAPQLLTAIADAEWADLLSALNFLLDKVPDNDSWSKVGYGLLSLQSTRPAEQLFYEFSRKAVGYQPGVETAWWDAHKNQQPRSDYRAIFALAREKGYASVSAPGVFAPVPSVRERGQAPEVSEPDVSGGGPDGSNTADPGGPDVAPPPLPDKPIVRLVTGDFSNIIRQLEEIIEPHIFTQGPKLVRPTEAHNDDEIRRSSDALMLCEATKAWAKKQLGDLAIFMRPNPKGGAWRVVDPEASHINALLELGSWTVLRPLEAIARAPFVRADGSICDNPGYDRRSRVLYLPGAAYPAIAAVPDRGAAEAALARVRGVFHQFPWKESASESAFVSHILTEAARLAVDRCPMFFYTAPSAGTGKGLLSEMASTIVHGTVPAIRTWVSDGDELRKVLFAALLAGDRSLLFDNVPTGFKTRAPELCAFITADQYNGRKLGESESHTVPNRAVLSATGNNITPVGDMARRSIVIRLDANTERLKQRVFEIEDLRTYVMTNRPQLLVDALTIIKAYALADDVEHMPVLLPSFERWSRVAREPLIWLGMSDPVETQKEADDETDSLGAVFAALANHFGDREFTCNDVARVAGGLMDADGELITSMQQSGCSEPGSPMKVGYWMRGCRDKIVDGIKLVALERNSKAMRYKFVRVEETLT